MHVNRVVYAEIDGDECTVVNDYVDGVPSMTGRFPWAALVGSRTEEILEGGTLLANDTSIEPHTVAEREALRAVGIGAYLCPLLVKGGRFVGHSACTAASRVCGQRRSSRWFRTSPIGSGRRSRIAGPKPICARTKNDWRFSFGSTMHCDR
jgi:hypothetical protein